MRAYGKTGRTGRWSHEPSTESRPEAKRRQHIARRQGTQQVREGVQDNLDDEPEGCADLECRECYGLSIRPSPRLVHRRDRRALQLRNRVRLDLARLATRPG